MILTDRQLNRLRIDDDGILCYDQTDPDMVGLPQTTACCECGRTIPPRVWLDTCNALRADVARLSTVINGLRAQVEVLEDSTAEQSITAETVRLEAELARVTKEHLAQREVDLAVLREWKSRAEKADAEVARLKAEAELGRQFAAYYRRHVADTTALPCQEEDAGKGQCVYNWRRAFERDLERCLGEALAALAKQEGGR